MSFAQLTEVKERIRESVEIADLVGSYMDLRRKGTSFVGLCPWHNDSNPSFDVNPSRQTWRCWVCGEGGDLFSFVMKYEGVEFIEALRMLADRVGIELPKISSSFAPGGDSHTPEKKRSFFKILEWAEKRFHHMLLEDPAGAAGRDYLEQRGITSESIDRYRIGFAPKSWNWLFDLAQERNIDKQSLVDVGLVGCKTGKYYDLFRGRVVFPIQDLQGRPIAFGGRILPGDPDGDAKYYNSPETQLFKKRSQLYGLNVVRKELTQTRAVTVMEGYTDVVMARQLGVMDPVAVLGTALGEGHIKLLQRHVDKVTLVLDGDEAGRKRTNELLNLFIAQKVDLRVLTLPDDLDPCDYVQQNGAEAFTALRDDAPDALEQKIENELNGIDPIRDTHRGSVALENILQAISLIPRTNDGQGSKELILLIRLARRFGGIDSSELRKRLVGLRKRAQTRKWVEEEPTVVPVQRFTVPESERELLEILLLAPELADVIVSEVTSEQFSHPDCKSLFERIVQHVVDGQLPDFETLLSGLHSPEEQFVLVDIDEHGQEKAAAATASPLERWEIWREFRLHAQHRDDAKEQRRRLESDNMNEKEAITVLEALMETKRSQTKKLDTEEWS